MERYLFCCKGIVPHRCFEDWSRAINGTRFRYLRVESCSLAVIRGDVEIVKILLENGADPYIENDLGMNAFDMCNNAGPFPSVYRALKEHVNKE